MRRLIADARIPKTSWPYESYLGPSLHPRSEDDAFRSSIITPLGILSGVGEARRRAIKTRSRRWSCRRRQPTSDRTHSLRRLSKAKRTPQQFRLACLHASREWHSWSGPRRMDSGRLQGMVSPALTTNPSPFAVKIGNPPGGQSRFSCSLFAASPSVRTHAGVEKQRARVLRLTANVFEAGVARLCDIGRCRCRAINANPSDRLRRRNGFFAITPSSGKAVTPWNADRAIDGMVLHAGADIGTCGYRQSGSGDD
jgi:hypothetical protein